MVETITPVVHGGRRSRWAASLALHVLGAALSAAALGALLGAGGALLDAPWGPAGPFAVGIIALLYAARELAGLPVPVPDLRRQVPERWRSVFSPEVSALLYGLGLGTGFLTHLRFGTLVAVAVAAAASGSPLTGALVFAAFGLARSLPIALVGSARDDESILRVLDAHGLERVGAGRIPAAVNGIVLAALGLVGIAASGRVPGGAPGSAAGLLLAAVFAWAGLIKLVRPTVWRAALDGYALPHKVRPLAASIVPPAELAVAAVLAFGDLRLGSAAALAMLAAFSIAILRVRRSGESALPCGCLGTLRTRPVHQLLARNALLAALGLMAMLDPAADAPIALPDPSQILPALLTVAGAGLVVLAAREVAALRRTR
jgi:Methylamine utilisation protein MauE/Cytochrome C biogenesis protein transmembrane region